MPERNGGSGAGRRRSKRLLSPSQKYEVWLQRLRQEVTIAEAATAHQVDRSTIMRIKQVAKDGAWRRSRRPNPESRPGARLRAGAGPCGDRAAVGGVQRARGEVDAGGGK